jgi:hypothetical protein
MSIFVNQGYYLLTLETGIDISAASTKQIKYKKPDGTTGNWTATLQGTTQLKYQMDNDDLNIAGMWTFQAYVVIGGLDAYGGLLSIEVKQTI